MAKRSHGDVGFDVAKALKALRVAAVKAGAFPKDDPRAARPHMVADAHLHGLEDRPGCTRNPCRLGGLCLALHEIVQYEAEAEHMKASLEAATIAEEVSGLLNKAEDGCGQALELLRPADRESETGKRDGGQRVGARKELGRSLQQLTRLVASVDAVARELRSAPWSAEHQQPSKRKKRALLLTAVWQHLDWGGLPYDEIFGLVPGLGSVAKPKDVVRKRVASADARSLKPRQLHPRLFEAPSVEKHRRRRSST